MVLSCVLFIVNIAITALLFMRVLSVYSYSTVMVEVTLLRRTLAFCHLYRCASCHKQGHFSKILQLLTITVCCV